MGCIGAWIQLIMDAFLLICLFVFIVHICSKTTITITRESRATPRNGAVPPFETLPLRQQHRHQQPLMQTSRLRMRKHESARNYNSTLQRLQRTRPKPVSTIHLPQLQPPMPNTMATHARTVPFVDWSIKVVTIPTAKLRLRVIQPLSLLRPKTKGWSPTIPKFTTFLLPPRREPITPKRLKHHWHRAQSPTKVLLRPILLAAPPPRRLELQV